jgi:hypothetical protein
VTQQLRLSMPAVPALLRVPRLTIASLAAEVGFDVEEIEDLRLALDELCQALVAENGSGGGTLELQIEFGGPALVVNGALVEGDGDGSSGSSGEYREAPSDGALNELSRLLLEALVDSYQLAPSRTSFSMSKARRHPPEKGR